MRRRLASPSRLRNGDVADVAISFVGELLIVEQKMYYVVEHDLAGLELIIVLGL